MSVYKPTYRDQKTGKLKQAKVWWYHFSFGGRRIQESSKSTRKTIAQLAEKNRRLELEKGFNEIEDKRGERIRSVTSLLTEFITAYNLRNPRSVTFAAYAVKPLKRILGRLMAVDLTAAAVKDYQTTRLAEKAAPKTINEEVGFLLRVLGERGDFIRAKLKREQSLKLTVHTQIARAFSEVEKAAMLAEAKRRRSPAIYPALMLALHAGMRDAEIRGLQWGRIDLQKAIVTVGAAKTEAGEGRTIPLNADVLEALVEHSKWFLKKFGTTHPLLYVFPFGKPQPTDASRHVTTFSTVWTNVKNACGIKGRWHDNRHTFITDLAERGEAADGTIMDIAGHVSHRMLKHYSHIGMEAKRRAVDSLAKKAAGVVIPTPEQISNVSAKVSAKVELLN